MAKRKPFILAISYVSNVTKYEDVILPEHKSVFDEFVKENKKVEQFMAPFQQCETIDETLHLKWEAKRRKNNLDEKIKKASKKLKQNIWKYNASGSESDYHKILEAYEKLRKFKKTRTNRRVAFL